MRSHRGMTLVEVLVAMTVPTVALAGTQDVQQSQRRPLERTPDAVPANLAGPGECQALVGADASGQQPLVVYAAAFRFGFEVGCGAASSTDRMAAYPGSAVSGRSPGTSYQTIAWPGSTAGETGTADTVTFFFQADRSTPRTDDFMMMRQTNGEPPEPVLRNVLAYPGRPFFQYYYRKAVDDGRPSTHPVPASWLPLQHTAVAHGTTADTGAAARIDTLVAVEVNYSVTAGRPGAGEQIQPVSTVVPLSSLTRKKTRPCDEEPFFSLASMVRTASYRRAADADLLWNPTATRRRESSACRAT